MQAFRASILHLLGDPTTSDEAVAFHADGLLLVEDGHVVACGDHDALRDLLGDTPVEDLSGKLITPGFIDTHIHFPQVDIIAAHGAQLLDWLEQHTFPAEAAFADPAHAAETAEFFVRELLRNGTTTALVFGSVHKGSVEALFRVAQARDMRLIAGKSLMDRHAPEGLTDTVESSRADMESLIADWHGKGRLGYAVTPRFAISCSEAQLTMAGEVLAAHPGVWMQTHLSENPREIAETAALFPEAADYLDVYDRFGLLGPRSVFAHCVHLQGEAFQRLADSGGAVAFCPTSNLFLGSGLFPLETACAHGVKVGIGTDVGAGTSFSILHTLGEAYKVGQLRGSALDPFHALYLATLGGARALDLGDRIGNLAPGKEADFLVLDLAATPLLARRLAGDRSLENRLFALTVLGDDRVVERTYLAGVEQHRR
ncbi:guanine deaminase [Caulobacter henricii]|uniref:Guanine deaminase n=1 Tax=Caulobacter henricii TaxID=69395 RepID=A0A0P0NXA3_9CAUL|nr:guanine deaminase [Caulobacter henricii]ALL12661.1 guanine deaminase [Caulobacter henricii]